MTDHDLFVTDRGRGPLRCVARSIGSIAARRGREGNGKKPPIYEADRPRRAASVAAAKVRCTPPGLDALVAFPLSLNHPRSASLSLSRISIADTD